MAPTGWPAQYGKVKNANLASANLPDNMASGSAT